MLLELSLIAIGDRCLIKLLSTVYTLHGKDTTYLVIVNKGSSYSSVDSDVVLLMERPLCTNTRLAYLPVFVVVSAAGTGTLPQTN